MFIKSTELSSSFQFICVFRTFLYKKHVCHLCTKYCPILSLLKASLHLFYPCQSRLDHPHPHLNMPLCLPCKKELSLDLNIHSRSIFFLSFPLFYLICVSQSLLNHIYSLSTILVKALMTNA